MEIETPQDQENALSVPSNDLDPSALAALLAAERATRTAAAGAGRWLEEYRRAARDTLSSPALDDLLRDALAAIARTINSDAVSLLLANDDSTALVSRASYGLLSELDLELSIPAGAGLSGPVLSSGEPRLVDDLWDVDVVSDALRANGLHSYLGVPIRSNDRVFGVLHVTRRRVKPFNERDAELLGLLADPIASAIERVRIFELEREARDAAEVALAKSQLANERVRGLQHITAALASASTVAEICAVILNEVVPGVTDSGGERAIWMFRDSRLLLVAGSGLSAQYPEIPLDPSLPAAENLREGTPLFIETRAELESRWPVLGGLPTAAFAGLPLILEGKRLGVMAVGFREEHSFGQDERDYLVALSEQAAAALARADAKAALNSALEIAQQRGEQLDFLAEASARLSSSLDLDVTLETIAELSVPLLTDRCVLFLLDGQTIEKRVLAPALNQDERQLFDDTELALDAERGVGAVIRTGTPEYVPEIDDSMLVASAGSKSHLDLLRRVGIGGMLLLPLRAHGRVIGVLALVNRTGRIVREDDRLLSEELAARAAVAIDNALLYGREAHVAKLLASTLLPTRLPTITGLDLAARYVAGSEGLEVGGDFYDVYSIGPNRWLVAIGDVQGKGIEAAAVTSLARHTIKAASLYESSTSAILQHLNMALLREILDSAESSDRPWDKARLCTAALIRLDRTTRGWEAMVSCAGHPPPLVRFPSGRVEAMCEPALMLGVAESPRYTEASTDLPQGAYVVAYTDGVSDRLTTAPIPGDDAVAALLRGLSGGAQGITTAISEAALKKRTPPDDLVVLAVGVES